MVQPDTFVVHPYHPDLLRRPEPPMATMLRDIPRQALAWNLFRTLEQVAPPVWLRLLVASLIGFPEGGIGAPQTVRVSCWAALPHPPAASLRRGRRGTVDVDVLIETEVCVVALATPSLEELASPLLMDTPAGSLLDLAEATGWHAGRRRAYVGVVIPPEADPGRWRSRVLRRASLVSRLVRANAGGDTNLAGVGVTSWPAQLEMLRTLAETEALPVGERRIAADTAAWMDHMLVRLARRRWGQHETRPSVSGNRLRVAGGEAR